MSVIAEQRSRTRAAKQLGYLPLSFAVLIMVLPLAWMIISSLKRPGELLSVPVVWLPADPTMANYERAMDMVPVGRFFLNSTMVTVIGAGLKVALALTTAYALVFIRIPGRKVVFTMVLVALMVPLHITLVPNYTLIAQMGGRNTLWGIILPGLGTAFATFLLRQQFLTLPHSVVEAAQIDGADAGGADAARARATTRPLCESQKRSSMARRSAVRASAPKASVPGSKRTPSARRPARTGSNPRESMSSHTVVTASESSPATAMPRLSGCPAGRARCSSSHTLAWLSALTSRAPGSHEATVSDVEVVGSASSGRWPSFSHQ